MRLNLKSKVRRRLLTRERQPLSISLELNRVWALDFMRDTLYDGRPFRTLNVIDVGNREALHIECGTSIPSACAVRVMDQLLEVYGKPEAIRLDNGPELTADLFVAWAQQHGVKLLFIQPGKPNQNASIECFNSSFRPEVLDAWLFNAVSEVQPPAPTGSPITTNFGRMTPWAACRQSSSNPGHSTRMSQLLNCLLHRGAYWTGGRADVARRSLPGRCGELTPWPSRLRGNDVTLLNQRLS